jgi:hypothetical protein
MKHLIFKAVGPKLGDLCLVDVYFDPAFLKETLEMVRGYLGMFPLGDDEPLRTVRFEGTLARIAMIRATSQDVERMYAGASSEVRNHAMKVLSGEGVPIPMGAL